jgi:hypothetical protein
MISSKERGVAPFQGKLLDRLPLWYIVSPSHDHCIEGTPPENILALYDEAKKCFK